MIYFAYLAIFTVEFLRAYFNIGMLATRFSTDFGESSALGFILSFWLRPVLITGTFIYIINHIKANRNVEGLIDILIISFVIFALATLLVSVELILSGGDRNELKEAFNFTFGHHYNTVGTILMLGIPLAMNRALNRGKLWLGIFAIIVLALFFSQSRGAILGGIVGLISYFYFLKRINFTTILLFGVIGLLGFAFSEPIIALFSRGMDSGDLSKISSGRIDSMWLPLLAELIERPVKLLFGYGLYGVIQTDAYVMVAGFFTSGHAHNAYIDFLIDVGIIIFIPFSFLVYYSITHAIKWGKLINNPSFYSLLSSVIVYFAASISERQFFPRTDNMMLWPIIALIVVMIMNARKEQKKMKARNKLKNLT